MHLLLLQLLIMSCLLCAGDAPAVAAAVEAAI
jgi:hypothetical protein